MDLVGNVRFLLPLVILPVPDKLFITGQVTRQEVLDMDVMPTLKRDLPKLRKATGDGSDDGKD